MKAKHVWIGKKSMQENGNGKMRTKRKWENVLTQRKMKFLQFVKLMIRNCCDSFVVSIYSKLL